MSKSLGNVLDPLELIDQYGAVRFTLSSMAAMGRDLRLSTDRVIGYRNFVQKFECCKICTIKLYLQLILTQIL